MNTKKIRRHRNQRGVALLLALGSLSLMLVTGMAFLSNAIIARQAAANYRGRAQAKYIARSAVARLMMRIKYNLNNADFTRSFHMGSTAGTCINSGNFNNSHLTLNFNLTAVGECFELLISGEKHLDFDVIPYSFIDKVFYFTDIVFFKLTVKVKGNNLTAKVKTDIVIAVKRMNNA